MTSNSDILAGLLAAAEAAVKRAEQSHAERRSSARAAGAAVLAEAFGTDAPPAPTPGTDASTSEPAPSATDEARAEVEAIRADLDAALDGEAASQDGVDGDLPGAPGKAGKKAEGPATAVESASSDPDTDAAFRAMLADSDN